MKKEFIVPEISISAFDAENIVTGSGLDAYSAVSSGGAEEENITVIENVLF